jgi:ATP-dependent DNA ligase
MIRQGGDHAACSAEVALPVSVQPMLAASVDALPDGPGWAYEPKFDGWRAIAVRRDNGVHLSSRTGKPLSAYFPDITRAVRAAVPAPVVLDGELIVWQGEQTSFALLQRRISAGARVLRMAREHPGHYVVFDLLRDTDGRDLLDTPFAVRRARLTELLVHAPAQVPLCPQTTDPGQAREWLTSWTAAGVEGVVAKRLDGRYEPGRRGWRKIRARSTTEAIIGGVTGSITDPQTLLLGRLTPTGGLRYTGRTHPLSARQRRELVPRLAPAPHRTGGVDHPWPRPLPARWSGHFDRPEPLPYIQVEPSLVAEIDVDTAYEHHRWRHGVRHVRIRPDLSIYDVPLIMPDPPGRS